MAQELVRIYLKNGQIIEFESDGFQVDRGGQPMGPLHIGQTDMDLTYIDLNEIAAITKTPVRPSRPFRGAVGGRRGPVTPP